MSPERKRLALGLGLSGLVHALLLTLTFGGQGIGLPGFTFPWQDRRVEAPELTSLQAVLVTPPSPAALPLQAMPADMPQANESRKAIETTVLTLLSPRPAEPPPAVSTQAANPPKAKAKQSTKPKAATTAAQVTRTAPPVPALQSEKSMPLAAPNEDLMALAQSTEPTWTVPPAPEVPVTAVAIAPDLASSEVATPTPPEAVEKSQQAQRNAEQNEKIEAARVEAAKLEKDRKDAAAEMEAREEQKETARKEAARIETTKLEAAKAEAVRVEAARAEAARVAAARMDAARVETARVEAARGELVRIEALRVEAEKQDLARAAAARNDAARQEAAKLAAAKLEAAKFEAAKVATARAEAERKALAVRDAYDAANREAAQREAAKQEAAQRDAARRAAAQKAASGQDAANAAAAQGEAERQEGARQAAARQEASRLDAARIEATRLAAVQAAAKKYEEVREERLKAIGRQLNEEADRRNAVEAAARLGPSSSTLRRGRLFGRTDSNAELVLYAEAWSRKIQLNMTFDMVRDAAKQPHSDPMVTVAIRSDGSVESVSFVRSSGVPAIDEAIRSVVQSQANYPAFSPALLRDYDVIEIRRTWQFDMAVRLY